MKIDIQFKRDYLWVTQHCKKCPRCGWSIEKNEGCNHMTCRLCHHEFCWLCSQNYSGHNDKLCVKLSKEKIAKKQILSDTLKNFSKKDQLITDMTNFFGRQKRKEEQTLPILTKKGQFEKIKQFKKMEEIDEFLFLTNKIPFVFVPNESEQKELKRERDQVLLKLTRFKNMKPNDRMEKEFVQDNLRNYMRFLEIKLDTLRKSQMEFETLCNI